MALEAIIKRPARIVTNVVKLTQLMRRGRLPGGDTHDTAAAPLKLQPATVCYDAATVRTSASESASAWRIEAWPRRPPAAVDGGPDGRAGVVLRAVERRDRSHVDARDRVERRLSQAAVSITALRLQPS